MPIIISLLIRFFLKYLVNSIVFLTIITCVFEFLEIKFEKLIKSNLEFFFSPAAYQGHIITKSDSLKHFENSCFKDNTLEYR